MTPNFLPLFESLYHSLEPRKQKVLRYRFGLTDGRFHTFQETGARFLGGVSRQRAQQLEVSALSLSYVKRKSFLPAVEETLSYIFQTHHRVLSRTSFEEALKTLHPNPHFALGAFQIVCRMFKAQGGIHYFLNEENEGFYTLNNDKKTAEKVRVALKIMQQILQNEVYLPRQVLIKKIQQSSSIPLSAYFLKHLLHEALRQRVLLKGKRGVIFLRKAVGRTVAIAALALKRIGKPSHYLTIHEEVNRLQYARKLNPLTIHRCLSNHRERFVWTGRPGVYGLVEWNIPRAVRLRQPLEKSVAILVNAFRKIGRPCHYSELLGLVHKRMKLRKPSRFWILNTLTRVKDTFVWTGVPGYYGLKEWGLKPGVTLRLHVLQVLQKARTPMNFQELLSILQQQRPKITPKALLFVLTNSSEFVKIDKNVWCLTDHRLYSPLPNYPALMKKIQNATNSKKFNRFRIFASKVQRVGKGTRNPDILSLRWGIHKWLKLKKYAEILSLAPHLPRDRVLSRLVHQAQILLQSQKT